ncbi:DUF4269 domain-containing protein [Marinigracilibium pacificum]|uniref:DUF4269 domain-containing protein n=1 Tax=Marinigracilibium pacificum TaxID=2729599 RepID=A0A848ITJ0_9BACT|nr:DUF4269 domain-containing protein [Marinigracilibium pacificum]NMM47793.1 DUF4269 domain-containing protein [Marinigracilibium pacificum]
MIDFTNIDYLLKGTPRQRKAYNILLELDIFDDLEPYSPVLTGTVPLDIDLPESDLDIICYVTDLDIFYQMLIYKYGDQDNFNIKSSVINGVESIIASFYYEDFPIEIFGQNMPVYQQNAFKHMLAEYYILNEKGSEFKEEVVKLKSIGYKTEPAFAELLSLEGDPYVALLDYHDQQIDI